jgi:hypothetical protein
LRTSASPSASSPSCATPLWVNNIITYGDEELITIILQKLENCERYEDGDGLSIIDSLLFNMEFMSESMKMKMNKDDALVAILLNSKINWYGYTTGLVNFYDVFTCDVTELVRYFYQ